MVPSFKYLGRVLSAADDDWSAVIHNLKKAEVVWIRMAKILSREVERPRVYGFFFKAVVQSMLLFGVETWVVTPRMVQVLAGFQYQVVRRMTGQLTRWISDGICEYTSTEAIREEAGFDPMDTYIWRRNNTVVRYIAKQPILDLCEAV